MASSLMTTYASLPIAFEYGEGAWLFDEKGNKYLDAVGGIAVCSLGHAHPAISDAICAQSRRLIHTSNLYQIPLQQKLADKLTRLADMEKVFFGNSGAEANEAALKIARLFGHHKQIDNPMIIVTENSFHGRTLATLSATGNKKIQAGFEPLVPGFIRVPYDNIAAIKNIANKNPNIVAVLLEPVQGEGGVNVPNNSYLDGIRRLCDEHNWLMMLDEIQTGIGRTGKWFAYMHSNSKPDVMTLAKALGNGFPIGACLVSGKASNILQPGTHGSTYGGNPLASAVALAVLNTFEQNNLILAAEKQGIALQQALKTELEPIPEVKKIRGQGLIIGVELEKPCAELVHMALDEGLLINVTAGNVIRLLPPLIINHEQIAQLTTTLGKIIKAFIAKDGQ